MPARLLHILTTPITGSTHRWKVLGWSIGEEDAIACYWHLLLVHGILSCVVRDLSRTPRCKPSGLRSDPADGAGVAVEGLAEGGLEAPGEDLPPRVASAT